MADTFSNELGRIQDMIRGSRLKLRSNTENQKLLDQGVDLPAGDIWAERPVGPREFVTGRHFLNDTTGNIWEPLRADLEQIFSGPDKYGRPSFFPACNVFVNVSGIGSGKSTFIALLNAYYIYLLHCLRDPLEYYEKFAGTTLLMLNVAPNEDKARRIVYQKLVATVKRMAWFQDNGFLPLDKLTSMLKFYGRFSADYAKMTTRELTEVDKMERKGYAEVMPLVLVRPGSSQMSEATGEDLLVGVIDEACSDGGFETMAHDRCKDIFMNMNERRQSRFVDDGIVAMISSAGNEDRFVENFSTRFEQHCLDIGKDYHEDIVEFEGNKVLYKRRAAYDCNPRFQAYIKAGKTFRYTAKRELLDGRVTEKELVIPEFYRIRFEENPEDALKNICALPQVVTGKYITEWERIVRNINKERIDPLPDNGRDEALTPRQAIGMLPVGWGVMESAKSEFHYCHVDLALGGTTSSNRDGAGFTVGHPGPVLERDGIKYETVVIDLSVRFKAKTKKVSSDAEGILHKDEKELSFGEIRDFIFHLADKRGFNFAKITFDGWQSVDSIQILNKRGYLAEKASCTRDSFECMKQLWYDGRLDIFHDDHALWELRRLVDYGMKIEKAPGASDDEIECIARVCEMCVEGEHPEVRKRRARPIMGPSVVQGSARHSFGRRVLPGAAGAGVGGPMLPAMSRKPRPR